MPKLITYPQASQTKALVLAKAVDSLGGTCSQPMAAEKIGMKPGGGFNVIVSAAVKYGFLLNKKGELSVTSLLRELQHAYSEEEEAEFFCQSLLSVPLYQNIYDRFKGQHLPVGMLDKLLIREMGVGQTWASKVTKYFIDDAKKCGLLGDDHEVIDQDADMEETDDTEPIETNNENANNETNINTEPSGGFVAPVSENPEEFVVSIRGPGMNTSITINDQDDMVIVEATLNKIRRKLEADHG